MNDTKRYYVIQNDEQTGPMGWDDLRQLRFGGKACFVWTEGLTGWLGVASLEDIEMKFRMNQDPYNASILPNYKMPGMEQYRYSPGPGAPVYKDPLFGTLKGTTEVFAPASAAPVFTAADAVSPASGDPVLAEGYVYGSPLARLGVFVINWALCGFVSVKYLSAIEPLGLFLLIGVYGTICYTVFSGTLAHFILGLKVVDATTGDDIKNPLKGGLRESVKMLLAGFIITDLWLLWDKRKQNLYDKIFKTVVVKKNKRML